jgi:hypothetical protein
VVDFSCHPCAIFVSNFCLCVDFESVGTVIHSQVDYSRLAGKSPVLLLNTEGFDWASLRDCRNKFLEGRAKADNVDTPLVTVLMTIKVSSHLSISMSPNYLSQNNDMSHPWGPKSSRGTMGQKLGSTLLCFLTFAHALRGCKNWYFFSLSIRVMKAMLESLLWQGTEHMDQSDFPLLFPTIAKRARYVLMTWKEG